MAGGPDVHSRCGAKHDGAHIQGAQALERVDDTLRHPGTDGVAVMTVVKGDDADSADHLSPDVSRAACAYAVAVLAAQAEG